MGIQFALRKSGIVTHGPLMFRKVIPAIASVRPNWEFGFPTSESKGATCDVGELKRISVKIPDTSFLEDTEIILVGETVESEEETASQKITGWVQMRNSRNHR